MYVIPCYHSLADCMRGMEFDAWVGMLKHVFDLLLVYLSSVQVSQRGHYYNVANCLATHCSPLFIQQASFHQGSLKVIASVCEAAGGRKSATKVQEDSMTEPASTDAITPRSSVGFEPDIHQHHHRAGSLSDGDSMANMAEDLSMVMQSFEVQEAEDRLEQLLMEDELSDARIGIGAPPLPPHPQFMATAASSTAGEKLCLIPSPPSKWSGNETDPVQQSCSQFSICHL